MTEEINNLMAAMKGQIVARGYTQEDVAKRIGMNHATLNRKINSRAKFTLDEYVAIANSIGMSFKQLSDIAALQ